MSHLTFEDVLAQAEEPGRESPPHLATCRVCRDEVEAVGAMLGTLAGGPGAEPPADVLARAQALFGAGEQLAGAVRRAARWLGELRLDSAAGLEPAMAGVRAAEASTRQLLFAADPVEIDLAHAIAVGPVSLRGQALPAGDGADDLVALRPATLAGTDGVVRAVTSTDATGAFRFDDVAPGSWELRLELADGDVAVSFDIPAA